MNSFRNYLKLQAYNSQGLNCCSRATAIPFDNLSVKDIAPNTKAPFKINF